jgi:hypothetical protein
MKRVLSEDEEDDVHEEESAHSKFLRSLGVESSDESDDEEEEEDEEIDENDDQNDDENDDDVDDGDNVEIDQDENDQEEVEQGDENEKVDDEEEEEDDDNEIEEVNEEKEEAASFADENDPFRLIFCREYEEGSLEKQHREKNEKLRPVCKLQSGHKLSANFDLVDAAVFVAPSVNNFAEKSEMQSRVFDAFGSYGDSMICGVEGVEMRAQMRDVAALHIVNHVVKTRNKIWAGNCMLRKDKVL